MNSKILRVYKKVDFDAIKESLMIYGTLSAQCAKCNNMNLKLDSDKCPACQTEFKYIAFRTPKENMPKILRIAETRPNLTIVDFDDYKRIEGTAKAEGLFHDK